MPLSSDADLAARCGPIEVLVVDVDGVLTDGTISIDDQGAETKHFHVRDGTAFTVWRKAGKRAAILSGRSAQAVEHRAAELKIAPVVQGAADKAEPFRALLAGFGVDARHVCYIGDDLADLPVLASVGLAACPADAVAEVKNSAQLVTTARGGRGAVREVVEVILKQQGAWDAVVERYRKG